MGTTYGIVAVCTGTVQQIGTASGRPVMSAFQKQPAPAGSSLSLGSEGLEGDTCADQRVVRGRRIHGGELQAVYAYARKHYAWWEAQLDEALPPGSFGENLLLDRVDENTAHVGDIWVWGTTVLQVTKPRRPCYKLGMLRGLAVPQLMVQSGHCGWYLRVVKTGRAPTSGRIALFSRQAGALSIAEAFRRKVAADPAIPGPPD